jgi:hypothetical protein
MSPLSPHLSRIGQGKRQGGRRGDGGAGPALGQGGKWTVTRTVTEVSVEKGNTWFSASAYTEVVLSPDAGSPEQRLVTVL